MKASVLLIVSVLLITSCLTIRTAFAGEENLTIPADDEHVVLMGRWYPDSRGTMRGGFECGLALRFRGTGIRLSGRASGTALIAIDGGEPVQKTLKYDMVLAEGLETGEHLLELYAAYQIALPVITGFSIDAGGEFLPASEDGKRKIIEFVGDSIMEGYVDPKDARDGVFNSYSLSYAFLTGRELFREYGMSFSTIAYGGMRVIAPGDNASSGNDPLGMPERYFLNREYNSDGNSERAVRAAGEWDAGVYAPDYIVLNLGTNDVTGGNVFINTYAAFLKKLRETYPEVTLFVMTPFNGNMSSGVRSAVEAANDPKAILIDTSSWGIKGGADGLHPDPAAHERVSELLLDMLKTYITAAEESTAPPEETAPPTAEEVTSAQNTPEQSGDNNKSGSSVLLPLAISGGILVAAALAGVLIFASGKKKS